MHCIYSFFECIEVCLWKKNDLDLRSHPRLVQHPHQGKTILRDNSFTGYDNLNCNHKVIGEKMKIDKRILMLAVKYRANNNPRLLNFMFAQ